MALPKPKPDYNPDDGGPEDEDFLGQLLHWIANKQQEKAINALLRLDKLAQQVDYLTQLLESTNKTQHDYLVFNLHLASVLLLAHEQGKTRNRDVARDIARYLAKMRVLNWMRGYIPSLDTALFNAQDMARALNSKPSLSERSTLSVEKKSKQDLYWLDQIAYVTISLMNRYFHSFDELIERMEIGFHVKIADALDEALHLSKLQKHGDKKVILLESVENTQPSKILEVVLEVLWQLNQTHLQHITLEGLDKITPTSFANELAPMLEAIEDLQRVHYEIQRESRKTLPLHEDPIPEVRIVSMHNSSPKFEISGIGDIIRALHDLFALRKRRQEAEMRDLEKQLKEQEIEAGDIDLEDKQIELAVKRAKIELAMQRYGLDLAEDYINKYYPYLSPEQRLKYTPQIAEAILKGQSTKLTLRFGHHDTPRLEYSSSDDEEAS